MRVLIVGSILILVVLLPSFSGNQAISEPPSFYREVYPIIFTKCGGKECHGGDSRASVRYATYRSIYAYRKKDSKNGSMMNTNQCPLSITKL